MAGNLLKIIKIHNKEVNRKMSNEKIISGGGGRTNAPRLQKASQLS